MVNANQLFGSGIIMIIVGLFLLIFGIFFWWAIPILILLLFVLWFAVLTRNLIFRIRSGIWPQDDPTSFFYNKDRTIWGLKRK